MHTIWTCTSQSVTWTDKCGFKISNYPSASKRKSEIMIGRRMWMLEQVITIGCGGNIYTLQPTHPYFFPPNHQRCWCAQEVVTMQYSMLQYEWGNPKEDLATLPRHCLVELTVLQVLQDQHFRTSAVRMTGSHAHITRSTTLESDSGDFNVSNRSKSLIPLAGEGHFWHIRVHQ
jgi:hypothetical protein